MREFLKGLELDKETIDSIMAEYGKQVQGYKETIEENKTTIDDLKAQMEKAPKSEEMESLKNTIATYEAKEQERLASEKAKKEDELLTNNIISAFGDKKFVNDFTRDAIVKEMKTALNDDANKSKSYKDLFEEITKDKTDIFVNPNRIIDMPSVDESVETVVSKDDFDKMGYKERVEFKETNPELFNKYNNM